MIILIMYKGRVQIIIKKNFFQLLIKYKLDYNSTNDAFLESLTLLGWGG